MSYKLYKLPPKKGLMPIYVKLSEPKKPTNYTDMLKLLTMLQELNDQNFFKKNQKCLKQTQSANL